MVVFLTSAGFLASCPDARFRDGSRAVESALKACELTAWSDPSCLAALAAAHAESGDFTTAVTWQERALKLMARDSPDLRRHGQRLGLYREMKPYHGEG